MGRGEGGEGFMQCEVHTQSKRGSCVLVLYPCRHEATCGYICLQYSSEGYAFSKERVVVYRVSCSFEQDRNNLYTGNTARFNFKTKFT